MSVEQIFDDIYACKNQILSALGQDPNHDFRLGTRTFEKKDKKGVGRGIMNKMSDILQLCYRKAKPMSGGNMIGGGNQNSLSQIILSPSTTNQQIMVLANNVTTNLVKNITNTIFSGGLTIAIKSASLLTNPDSKGNYNDNINNTLNNVLNYGNLQENFFNDALKVLGTLNDITSIKFVKEIYQPLFIALKNPLGNDIKSILNQVETSSIAFLNNQVAEVLEGSDNICLYDLDSSVQLINSYATNELVNVSPIDVNLFIQLSKVDQISKLESINRKILAKLHSDRNINVSEQERESKDELYKDANNKINDMIESCFRSGSVLGQKRRILDDDESKIDDADTIKKRRKVKLNRGGKNQFGGGYGDDNYRLLNNKILNSSTIFMMRWLGVAEWNDEKLTSVTPIYSDIFESGGANYIMRDSVIHTDSNGAPRKVNPARITLNAQIAILWGRVNFNSQSSFKRGVKRFPLDPIYFDILASAKSKKDDNYWFGQNGGTNKHGIKVGWGNIDDQLQQAHNIIIRTYYPESVYKDGHEKDKFPLTSERGRLDSAGKASIGVDDKTRVSFVVNNASKLKGVDIGGLSGNALESRTFCPIASILDAMIPCSIGAALRDKSTVLYPMEYTIRSANSEFLYTVKYKPSKKGDSAILNATLSKSISDSGPAGNLFTISKKNLVFTDKDLSATEGYRGIIEDLFTLAENLGREGRQLRGRNAIMAFQDFLNQVMSQMIGSFAVKSIGDYAQEGTVTSIYSGVTGDKFAEDFTKGKTTISPSQDEGFSFRMGLAGDRPSAYRMVDTLLYANPTSINIDAMVGYLDGNSPKNFLIIHPMVSDKKAVKKLKRLAMKKGYEDSRYSPELLSKSLLRSKYCEATPSECNTLVKVDEDVATKEAVEDEDVDMIRDSPTSVSDVRKLESNETHKKHDGVWKGKLNKENLPHGYGVRDWDDGNIYEGQAKNGNRHGQGKMTYADGDVYEGNWRDDDIHGQGKMTYADGDVYEGTWKDSDFHGQGKMTYADGDVYEGIWSDEALNGQGKITYVSGNVYEGNFKDGMRHGKGKLTYVKTGNVYQGDFKDDKLHGEGIKTFKNGDVYEYTYKNGKYQRKSRIANIKGNVALAGGKSKKKTRKRKYKKRKTNKRKLRKKKTKRRKSTRKTKRKRRKN